jgi:hypothetical protein
MAQRSQDTASVSDTSALGPAEVTSIYAAATTAGFAVFRSCASEAVLVVSEPSSAGKQDDFPGPAAPHRAPGLSHFRPCLMWPRARRTMPPRGGAQWRCGRTRSSWRTPSRQGPAIRRARPVQSVGRVGRRLGRPASPTLAANRNATSGQRECRFFAREEGVGRNRRES